MIKNEDRTEIPETEKFNHKFGPEFVLTELVRSQLTEKTKVIEI